MTGFSAIILEIVAEAESERHAGGMPPSTKQEDVAAMAYDGSAGGASQSKARSFTGAYLKETLKKAPRAAVPEKPSKKTRRKSTSSQADQPDLIAAK